MKGAGCVQARRWLALAAVFGIVTSCGALKLPTWSSYQWPEMTVVAAPDANLNSPVALDLVFIREADVAMVEKVSALPAAKWFASRVELVKTFPAAISYKSWELAPGQTLKVPSIVFDSFGSPRVVAVFLFADYLTPGDHRLRAEQLQKHIIVQLGPKDFTVTTEKNE